MFIDLMLTKTQWRNVSTRWENIITGSTTTDDST